MVRENVNCKLAIVRSASKDGRQSHFKNARRQSRHAREKMSRYAPQGSRAARPVLHKEPLSRGAFRLLCLETLKHHLKKAYDE